MLLANLVVLSYQDACRPSVHSNTLLLLYIATYNIILPTYHVPFHLKDTHVASHIVILFLQLGNYPGIFRMFRSLFSMYACDCKWLWHVSYVHTRCIKDG